MSSGGLKREKNEKSINEYKLIWIHNIFFIVTVLEGKKFFSEIIEWIISLEVESYITKQAAYQIKNKHKHLIH